MSQFFSADRIKDEEQLFIISKRREKLPPELLKVERSLYYELVEYMVNEQRGRMIDAWDELLRAGLNEVRMRRKMEKEVEE